MEALQKPSSDGQSWTLGAVALFRLLQCGYLCLQLGSAHHSIISLFTAPGGYSFGTQDSNSSSSRVVFLLLNFNARDLCVTCAQLILGLKSPNITASIQHSASGASQSGSGYG